jgi:hypothetical protein
MTAVWISIAVAFCVIGIFIAFFVCAALDLHRLEVRSGRCQPRKYLQWIYLTRPAGPPTEYEFVLTARRSEDNDVESGARGSFEMLPKYEEPPPAYMAKESV